MANTTLTGEVTDTRLLLHPLGLLPKFIDAHDTSYRLVLTVTEDDHYMALYEDVDCRLAAEPLAWASHLNATDALAALYVKLVKGNHIPSAL